MRKRNDGIPDIAKMEERARQEQLLKTMGSPWIIECDPFSIEVKTRSDGAIIIVLGHPGIPTRYVYPFDVVNARLLIQRLESEIAAKQAQDSAKGALPQLRETSREELEAVSDLRQLQKDIGEAKPTGLDAA